MMIQLLSLALFAISAIPTEAQQGLQAFPLHLPVKSSLKIPTGQTLKFLTAGIGTQNYTCSVVGSAATGKWTSIGAKSDLRDLSSDIAVARTLTNDLMKGGKSGSTPPDLSKFPIIGKHFFAGPPNQILPVFNIDKAGSITATKTFSTPSPLKSDRNVDWLQLTVTQGTFAKTVFRTTTRGGKPPTTPCKPKDHLEVKYAALYTFYG